MARPPYFVSAPTPPSTEPGAVLFETDRLIIRRPRTSDANAIAAGANFLSIAANLRDRFPSPYLPSDAEEFMKITAPADDGSAAFPRNTLVCLKPGFKGNSDAELVIIGGMGCLYSTDVNFRSWELGYWFTPAVARNGYGLEATRGFVRWAFATWMDLNRIEAVVYNTNAASRGLLLKAGFAEEGLKRGAVFKNGQILDEVMFGIIRSDMEKTAADV